MARPAAEDAPAATIRTGAPASLPGRRPARRRAGWALAGACVLGLAGGLAWQLRPPPVPAPPGAVPPAGRPAALPAPAFRFAITAADEAAIFAHRADALTVFRFAPAPAVIVLDFPGLAAQGAMLNRVAALVEKAGQPRDRVLTDAELAAAIRAGGDTAATYYYGHDYPAAALARFFALTDAQHLALGPAEQRLRALAAQLGWLAPGAAGALISIPRAGVDADLDLPGRAALLHHELAHGEFFTNPRYAAYVRGFWRGALSAAERAAIRRFLGSEGYDTADEELMLNEMQAYVMFTYDARFFRAANVAMAPARRAELQLAFLAGMPEGWLKQACRQAVADQVAGVAAPGR